MIIVEHSAESLPPPDCAAKFAYIVERLHQPVSGPLMISLAVMMGHILRERVLKWCLPDEDHPIQAFFLYGTDKSLRERVQIR